MSSLLDKIRKIEALIHGAKTEGEMNAAISAKERIRNRLNLESQNKNKLKEYSLYTGDNWHKKLLLALCSKYGIRPYRYHRQKYTTVMVMIDPDFLNNVLWKEYIMYSKHLEVLVEEITDNLIAQIHEYKAEEVIQDNGNRLQ